MIILTGDHIGIRDPLTEEDIQVKSGRPPDQRYANRHGRPPGRGGYPGGGPPDCAGPPNGDGGLLVDKDYQALKDPLDQ